MRTVGSFELKTHLAKFLARVIQGESIGITRHGELIARIIPTGTQNRLSRKEAAEKLRLTPRLRLNGLTIRNLIDEGRTR